MSRNFDILSRIDDDSHQLQRVSSPPKRLSCIQPDLIRPTSEVGSELGRVVTALRRYWRYSALFAAGVLLVTLIGTLSISPTYRSTARVEIDPPGSETFSLDTYRSGSTDVEQMIDTQSEILKSAQLSVSVIRKLHLDNNPVIVGHNSASQQPVAKEIAALQLTPSEQAALRYFESNLQVVPVKHTSVIEIRFSTTDARLSAEIVNTLVSLFIDRNYGTRYDAVMQSSEWLSRQLADIRQKMEESNKALAEYQTKHGIADVDDKQNSIAQRMGELNRQLTQAQADRIQMQSFSGRTMDAESLPQVLNDPVVQRLTQQLAEKQAALAQARVVFGSKHPNIKTLQKEVEAISVQLAAYKRAIVAGVETSYAVARTREALLQSQMNGVTAQMNEMGQYGMLKRAAETNSDLYNRLYARIKEAGIAAASKSSNIRVIDQARVLDKPTMPRPLLNLMVGLLVAFFGGIGLALMREAFDNTARSPEEVAECTGISLVALVPRTSSSKSHGSRFLGFLKGTKKDEQQSPEPFLIHRPRSNESEAIRGLATAVTLASTNVRSHAVLVVSPFPREGKSTVAVNLAVALSEQGSTCLVEADLRQPVIGRTFGLPLSHGLSDVLSDSTLLDSNLTPSQDSPNLVILPAGTPPENPGPLVASEAMQAILRELRGRFTYIVIDSPPILPYAEGRTICTLVDEVILVGRYGKTSRNALTQAAEILAKIDAPVLGFVLNGVDMNIPGYSYYDYGYDRAHD